MVCCSMVMQRQRSAQMEQLTYATLYTGSDAKTHFTDEAMPYTR